MQGLPQQNLTSGKWMRSLPSRTFKALKSFATDDYKQQPRLSFLCSASTASMRVSKASASLDLGADDDAMPNIPGPRSADHALGLAGAQLSTQLTQACCHCLLRRLDLRV